MAFGMFKKKDDDDFSDFSSDKMGSADDLTQPTHMGLPLDGNMTNTSPPPDAAQGPSESDSFDANASIHSPKSFNQLHELSQQTQGSPESPGFANKQSMSGRASSPEMKLVSMEKDIQLVNAKMDAIKVVLESISSRLMHIEKIAEQSEKKEETVKW